MKIEFVKKTGRSGNVLFYTTVNNQIQPWSISRYEEDGIREYDKIVDQYEHSIEILKSVEL